MSSTSAETNAERASTRVHAGMGSSAMGASVLRRKIQDAGFRDITVVNKAISNLTDDVDLLVTHQDLANRAHAGAPSAALYTVDNFMGSPVYDQIVEHLKESNGSGSDAVPPAATAAAAAGGAATATATRSATLLATDSIVLDGTAADRDGAISEAGALLLASGAVDQAYVDSMHEREKSVSTYMGNLLAIPHGTNEAKGGIHHSALSFVRYPDGIEWKGKPVKFVVGVAGAGDDHLGILANLAKVFLDKAQVARLEAATSAEEVQAVLGEVEA